MTEQLRLAAYIRVSTAAQAADDAYGPERQQRAIRAWAKRTGHRLVDTFDDLGVSGTVEALDRPGFGDLLDAVRSGKVDGVVLIGLDRLARQLTTQEVALARVWQLGGRVFTVEGGGAEVLPDDADDPMRTAMRQMAGVFAQLDKAMIVKRMRDGRRVKADAGGYTGGAPAFGFRAEGHDLVVDPAEAEVLQAIEEKAAAGLSLRQIATELNEAGVSTKRGGRWHPNTVARILDPAARRSDAERAARARADRRRRKAAA